MNGPGPSDARGGHAGAEWFAAPGQSTPGEAGLRFSCTQCGNCCSGPPGYVLISASDAAAMSARLGLTTEEFERRYTRRLREGWSLNEVEGAHGFDCVFLDRHTHPGRAVCSIYDVRPAQCRTWPFWPSNLKSPESWARAGRVCPGINKGPLYTPVQIRVQRDAFNI